MGWGGSRWSTGCSALSDEGGSLMPEPAVGLPVLGLALRSDGDELLPLLTALRSWCRPTTLRGVSPQPVAVLTDHVPDAAPDVPWAVVSRDAAVLEQAENRGWLLPDGDVPTGVAYVPPFVRERLRRARGLPEQVVLTADRRWTGGQTSKQTGDRQVPDDLLDTALGCAGLVVADDVATAERALAWGAPTLCTRSVAEALGLTQDGHACDGNAVIAVDEDPTLLVGDVRRLARLSWRGRRWWEGRHDAALVAAQLALTLLPSTPGAARLRLAELGTPAGAEVRSRLSAALT